MALYGGEGKRARSGGGDGARRPLSTASRGSCMLSRSPCFFPVSSLVSFAAAARDPRTEGGRPGRAALQSPNRVVTNGQAAAGARQLQDYKLDLGGPQKKHVFPGNRRQDSLAVTRNNSQKIIRVGM
jgi:hypothetical protein